MAGLFIKVEHSLFNHLKLKRLARRCNISKPQAIGHLVLLWGIIQQYEPDGNINDWSIDDIADFAELDIEPQLFLDSLIEVGFLEYDENNNLVVHDWEEHNGLKRSALKREKDRLYAKESRAKKKIIEAESYQRRNDVEPTLSKVALESESESESESEKKILSQLEIADCVDDDFNLEPIPPKSSPKAGDIAKVWDCYQEHHKRAQMGEKQRKMIKSRLDEGYSVDDLKLAINNLHRSQFHVDGNYLKLEHALRDSDKVAVWIDWTEQEKQYNGYVPANNEHTYGKHDIDAIFDDLGGYDHSKNEVLNNGS